jgi:hypothetical protein
LGGIACLKLPFETESDRLRVQILAAEDHGPLLWGRPKKTATFELDISLVRAESRFACAAGGFVEIYHSLGTVSTGRIACDLKIVDQKVVAPKAAVY